MNGMRKRLRPIAKMIVEKTDDGFWGRVDINNNLISDYAPSLDLLKRQMKKIVYDIEQVQVEDFEITYDLTSFFEEFSFLNISDIGKRADVNSALMRQYAAGIKFPSLERVKRIEGAIRSIGKELARIRLHKAQHAA
jgi:hypothetical protein